MAWYKVGTITVTNGSTTVTGSGTTWIANAGVGEALYAPDGRLYEITNIASDTSITITPAYLGSGASAQAYTFVPSQSYIRDLAAQAADLVNNYSTIYNTVGAGKFSDGTLAAPGIRFTDDLDTGFFRSASNEVTFVAGGVAIFKYNSSGLQLTNTGGFVNLTTTGNTTLGDAAADTVTINGTPTINAPTTISVNSATNALRITQTGTGNALLVEDSANPDSTPFVVDQNGIIGVGTTTPASTFGLSGGIGIQSTSAFSPQVVQRNKTNDSSAPYFISQKDRAGAIVQSGDGVGNIEFSGYDGASYLVSSRISASVDGTPGTNDMPGRLVFSTTRDGASSTTEAFRVTSLQSTLFGRAYSANERIGIGGTTAGLTSGTSAFGIINDTFVSSAQTNAYTANATFPSTQATAFTLSNLVHYSANQNTLGAGSSITNQFGFSAASGLTGATNNYGFYSNIASGTGRWNFFANGTADNFFAGNVGIGGSPGAGFQLDVQGSGTRSLRAWSTDTTGSTVGNIEAAFGSGGGTSIIRMRAGSGYTSLSSTGASDPLLVSVGGTERMRIASSGTISLGAAPGAESLRVAPVASAVNYVSIEGAATGGSPFVRFQGSDANITGFYDTTGSGAHRFRTNAYGGVATQFQIAHTASAVNYLQVTGSSSTFPTLSSVGSGANVDMILNTKGTGSINLSTNFLVQFVVAHTASAVNYLLTTGGATGNSVKLFAVGSDTNIDLALTPKGTGVVQYGTRTANADAAITGYITIKDSGGTLRKLAIID